MVTIISSDDDFNFKEPRSDQCLALSPRHLVNALFQLLSNQTKLRFANNLSKIVKSNCQVCMYLINLFIKVVTNIFCPTKSSLNLAKIWKFEFYFSSIELLWVWMLKMIFYNIWVWFGLPVPKVVFLSCPR